MAHPVLLAAIGCGDDRATLGRQAAEGWLPMTWTHYPRAQREVNRRLAGNPDASETRAMLMRLNLTECLAPSSRRKRR